MEVHNAVTVKVPVNVHITKRTVVSCSLHESFKQIS